MPVRPQRQGFISTQITLAFGPDSVVHPADGRACFTTMAIAHARPDSRPAESLKQDRHPPAMAVLRFASRLAAPSRNWPTSGSQLGHPIVAIKIVPTGSSDQ